MKHINRRIMQYQVIVLDLDGTLTNSKKEITEPTRQALIDIQKNGKTVVLASGRPINGVAPLAKQLRLQDFGGYMLSFNGARVTRCSDGKIIYNKQIPPEMIRPICDIVRSYAEQEVDPLILIQRLSLRSLRTSIPGSNRGSTVWRFISRMTLSPILISRSISCLSQDPQMSFRS